MADHEAAIEVAKQVALKFGIVANDEEMRAVIAAFLRAVEPSPRMCSEGESAASIGIGKPFDDEAIKRVIRDVCRALAEEIDV